MQSATPGSEPNAPRRRPMNDTALRAAACFPTALSRSRSRAAMRSIATF